MGQEPGFDGLAESGRYRVNKMWKDLYYGNGKPGICTRLELLEDAMDRTELAVEKLNKTLEKVVWLIVGTFIMALINLVVKK